MEAAAWRMQGATAPEAAWKPERVAADLDLSKRLIVILDAEKGITGGPFAAQPPPAEGTASCNHLTFIMLD